MNLCKIYIKREFFLFSLSCLMAASSYGQQTVKEKSFFTKEVMKRTIPVAFAKPDSLKTSTVSTSTVSSDVLRRINTASLGNTLFGVLPGLYIEQNPGSPGNDNPTMLIRGRQSFVDNSFIVLVDGFETKWSNLMVDEIESVSVLKDAAALALYGQDGANGVVLITTKKGKENRKNTIRFNSRLGFQSPTVLPSLLGNGDYAEMYNAAMVADGKSITSGEFKTQEIVDYYKNGNQPYLYPNVDWYGEMLKKSTMSQDYSLSIDGGNRFAKFFVAMGYLNAEGLYKGTDSRGMTSRNMDLKRYNIRSNVDVQITNWLSSEFKLRATMEQKSGPNADEGTLWKTMTLFNPYPVRTPDGFWGGKQNYSANPVASIIQKGYKSVNERTVDASVKLNAKLDAVIKGLSMYGQVNFSNNYWSTYDKTRDYAYAELTPGTPIPGVTPDGEIPYTYVLRGSTDLTMVPSQGSGSQWNRTNVISGFEFDRNFGKSSVYASLLYNQDMYFAKGADAAYAKQQLMGRVKYAYNSKYIAEFGYSYSGSENFPSDKRFGFFPALSGAWVISDEGFLRNNNLISFAKLRASVGLTGSDRVGNVGRFIFNQYYLSGGSYLLGGTNFDNAVNTFKEYNMANPNVTWEKALKYNWGIDAVIANHLSLTFDYFIEQRKDIFVNPSAYIPALIGIDFYSVNGGKTENRGFEVATKYNSHIGQLTYEIGGQLSFSQNKIVDMKEPIRKEEYLYGKGRPISQPFVLEAIGFFKDANDIKNSPPQLFGAVSPGDIKYRDQNGDGFIDDNDRIPIGKTSYPEMFYAMTGAMGYRGFDFNVLFQGSANRTVSLLDNNNIVPFLNGGVKPTQWVKDNYWTPERGDNAAFPRLTTESNNNNYRASTLFQRDGSFIRLKNIELGYSLPSSLLRKARIEKIRLYVSANNLFTWDKIDEIDMDPEVRDIFSYPALKSYNVGVSLQF